MTYSEQKTEINNIAKRLANGVNRWKQNGVELKKRVYSTIEMELDLMSFENENARGMMSIIISKTFAMNHPTQYQIVHQLIGMDQNGNYTHDKSKWA
jgi:hypothetical protein